MTTNTTLTADIIAREALMHLDNNLVFAKEVYRGYENEFSKKVNGYEVGETISIRRPTDFTVRTDATLASQDVTEGKVSLTVNQRRGVDFEFTSQDLTLKIGELGERVIKPAMIQLANSVDTYLAGLYSSVPNWVGTSGQTVDSFLDFAKAPERLDELAVPQDSRSAVLSPADHWALAGDASRLYMQGVANEAYRKGRIGDLGGVETFMSQNILTHTAGTRTNAAVDQSITSATTTYSSVKDTMTQTIHMDGLGTTKTVKAGDVFTIADVYAVNPVTKAALPFLKQFVVVSDVSSDAVTTGDADVVVYPALIWSGAFQNVAVKAGVTDINDKTVTWVQAAGAQDRQNLVFHKNAFALVMVPLVKPPGAVDVSRQSYKGTNVRIIPVYDGVNDISKWRCDILFGAKAIDPRLATRLSGTGT